ncbi:hypothetical protein M427DRAFT_31150 [Gonapodya prolifera JEL478]|uniref:Uncharacterized protein n=1 Tax=Gonapodya prolifera (strain JEL478) TaxID=1344416 RepID=A0A139AHY8_GONPJ|nr:hypothetical protein M427DRAFT_31150 [Gonapodya prolifera JEL478]|eukprot:KXS16417.1 hypothetical protein M427DRAFT_31150 [Gonapodya prolifera JEL478]
MRGVRAATSLRATPPRVTKIVLQLDGGSIPEIPPAGWDEHDHQSADYKLTYFETLSDSRWIVFFKLMPGSEYFKIICTCSTGIFHSRVHLDRMAQEIRYIAKLHGRKVLFEFGGKAHFRYSDTGNDIDRYLDGIDEDDNIYDEED